MASVGVELTALELIAVIYVFKGVFASNVPEGVIVVLALMVNLTD